MFLSLQAFTLKCFRQKRIDNSFLAVAFCPVYTAPFCQRKSIKQMECGRGILRRTRMYVLVHTKRQRKRKFFLIDVVVGHSLRVWRLGYVHIESVYLFLGVYTALLSPFLKFPLWSLDSIVCIFIVRFHRFSVNGRPKWREKFVLSSKNVLV